MVKTFIVPANMPNSQMFEMAMRNFCKWAHMVLWHHVIHGYAMPRLRGRTTNEQPET